MERSKEEEEIGGRRSILWFLQLTSFFNVIITWIRCRRLPALIGNCCRRCRRKQRTEWVVTGKCGRVSHEDLQAHLDLEEGRFKEAEAEEIEKMERFKIKPRNFLNIGTTK
ncbi:hypothetical protein LINPERHAP2_LOCUS29605 [Linum perenne]